MTDTRRELFEIMAKQYTEANTTTRSVARAALVREGIRMPNGCLAPEYGGSSDDRIPKKPVLAQR